MGAMLALIAMFSMSVLSTWHSAMPHDDQPPVTVMETHHHAESDPGDPDSEVHLAAHSVGQSLALPTAAAEAIHPTSSDASWSTTRVVLKAGLDPTSLLRPPQA